MILAKIRLQPAMVAIRTTLDDRIRPRITAMVAKEMEKDIIQKCRLPIVMFLQYLIRTPVPRAEKRLAIGRKIARTELQLSYNLLSKCGRI
jgi:hypothetical protein